VRLNSGVEAAQKPVELGHQSTALARRLEPAEIPIREPAKSLTQFTFDRRLAEPLRVLPCGSAALTDAWLT
jgi:hypothetical protein